jgi:hypothetical protein
MEGRLLLENNNLVIREARPGELEEVPILIRDAYREYEKNVPSSAWKAYVEDMMNVRSRLGVAS